MPEINTFPAFMASVCESYPVSHTESLEDFVTRNREGLITDFFDGAPGWASCHAHAEGTGSWRDHAASVMDPSNREPFTGKRKTSYVGVPAIFELTLACHLLVRGWGDTCYHVGSSLSRPDWRDVDVVMIMEDEKFKREFPNAPLHSAAWEHDAKWLVTTVALSKWLSEKTGLPVDFKFQPMTFANDRHNGPRNPVGLLYRMEEPATED